MLLFTTLSFLSIERNHLDVFVVMKFEQTKFTGSALYKDAITVTLTLYPSAKMYIAELAP